MKNKQGNNKLKVKVPPPNCVEQVDHLMNSLHSKCKVMMHTMMIEPYPDVKNSWRTCPTVRSPLSRGHFLQGIFIHLDVMR